LLVERKKEIIYMRDSRVDAERIRERKEERRHRTYHRRTKYHDAKHTNRKERERKKREIQRGRAALIAERESEHTKI